MGVFGSFDDKCGAFATTNPLASMSAVPRLGQSPHRSCACLTGGSRGSPRRRSAFKIGTVSVLATRPHQSTKAWSVRVVSPSVMSGTAPVTPEIGTVLTNQEIFVRIWQVVP